MAYSGIINPLDLQSILVEHLAGSITIFVILSMIMIGYLASKFRMNSGITFMMLMLFFTTLGIVITGQFLIISIIFLGVTLGIVMWRALK